MFFGRKLEISRESTMGGSRVTYEPRGMPYGLAALRDAGPFIPSDGEVRTVGEVGTIQGRCISGFAGLAEFEAVRAANRAAMPERRPNRAASIDARLARLGI